MQNTAAGIALLVMAGVMNASFTLPMKFTKKWAWENTWAIWGVWALLIMPLVTTWLAVPHLNGVYQQAGIGNVILVAVCGFAWGIAQVLFGLAVDAIGIALAFAIVLGLSAAIGSLLPLIRLHPEKITTPAGLGVVAGVALVLIGVSICAIAGYKREKAAGTRREGKMSSGAGLLCAVLSGIGAAAMNFGVAFGGPLIEAAKSAGANPAWSINAVWLPLMAAGFLPNLVYCLYLLRKQKSSTNFSLQGTSLYWVLTAIMAFFWFASTIMYGMATNKLGELGPVLGWPFFMSLIVIVATILGVATGEWREAGKSSLRVQAAGVMILIIAVVILSRAGQYL